MDSATKIIEVDGLRVTVEYGHMNGSPFVQLLPNNCDLDGEMPGLYYLVPSDT